MTSRLVKDWFGDDFSKLAPELQQLHLNGGKLMGMVEVAYGNGMAGMLGRRLAKKLNIPQAGDNQLVVNISHHENGLHWDRMFNNAREMKSTFKPVGNIKNGHWLEATGPLHIKLTVDIKDGGWYWKTLSYTFLGIPLPGWLFPQTEAYKYIENGKYRFYVAFRIPLLGKLLSYGGLLSMDK